MSRKKAAARAKRMAGQGLHPVTGQPVGPYQDPYKDNRQLVNPWLDPHEQPDKDDDRPASSSGR